MEIWSGQGAVPAQKVFGQNLEGFSPVLLCAVVLSYNVFLASQIGLEMSAVVSTRPTEEYLASKQSTVLLDPFRDGDFSRNSKCSLSQPATFGMGHARHNNPFIVHVTV